MRPSIQRRRLLACEDGALMVASLILIAFLVAMLYAVRGLNTAVAHQERLQDATDAASFSAASVYARSMNAIGLINQGQLVVSGVLQTIELIAINSAQCAVGGPPVCDETSLRYGPAYGQADDRLSPLYLAAMEAAREIRDQTPSFAVDVAVRIGQDAFGKPVQTVIAIEPTMPLDFADVQALCSKSHLYLRDLVQTLAPGMPLASGAPERRVLRDRERNFCNTYPVGPMVLSPHRNRVGGENQQIRVLAIGDGIQVDNADHRVERATEIFAKDSGSAASDSLRAHFAASQAEYYSTWRSANRIDSDTTTQIPEESTYYMDWRARLRRFRIPSWPSVGSGPGDGQSWIVREALWRCEVAQSSSSAKCDALSQLGPLLPHSLH